MEIWRTVRDIMKERQDKFHEVVMLLVLKYGSESWAFRTKDLRILQSAGMKHKLYRVTSKYVILKIEILLITCAAGQL
jgi:hypothetical protein